MLMSRVLIVAAGLAIAAVAVPAHAQVGAPDGVDSPRLDQIQKNQRIRIGDGVRNGSLTGRETINLLRGQSKTHRMERRFERDGVITNREKARMGRAEARQSHRIFRAKHNRKRR